MTARLWLWANNRVCAKTLDNRIGCYQLMEALRENDGQCPNDIYYVFCVQEELGCRGSKAAAERISRIWNRGGYLAGPRLPL